MTRQHRITAKQRRNRRDTLLQIHCMAVIRPADELKGGIKMSEHRELMNIKNLYKIIKKRERITKKWN